MDGRWVYGDAVFIVEPLFWLAVAPALVLASRSSWGRILAALPFATALGLVWVSGFVPPRAAFGATAFGVLSAGLSRWVRPSRRALVALGVVLAIATSFGVVGRRAEVLARARFADAVVHDVSVSPRPTDASCWRALALTESEGRLRTYRVDVEPLSALFRAGDCVEAAAPWVVNDVDAGFWRARAEDDCWGNAFLRFARFPVLVAENDVRWLVEDARFPSERNFTTMSIPKQPTECPRYVPGWALPKFLR